MQAMMDPLRKKLRPDIISANGHPALNSSVSIINNCTSNTNAPDRLLILDRKPNFPAALDSLASERESAGVGSKSKACLKFFSTSGCPYGEGCHFSHYIPGGVATIAPPQAPPQVTTTAITKAVIGPTTTTTFLEHGATTEDHKNQLCKNFGTAEGCRFGDKCHFLHGEKESRKYYSSLISSDRGLDLISSLQCSLSQSSSEGYKTRLCKNLQTPEGCRFADKCRFAHGESELRKPNGSGREPTPPGLGAAASFGSASTAKISIDASLAGLIIGKGGLNAKNICRMTGAKLFVKDHEADPNLRNIEMEGSLDQIHQASAMVRELLVHMDVAPTKPGGAGTPNYKTKLCENFAKGSCTYGERCHFAHGANDLRPTAAH